MVLDFAVCDNFPCWIYSLLVDDFGFEWSAFHGDYDDEQAWLFLISEQEH